MPRILRLCPSITQGVSSIPYRLYASGFPFLCAGSCRGLVRRLTSTTSTSRLRPLNELPRGRDRSASNLVPGSGVLRSVAFRNTVALLVHVMPNYHGAHLR